MISVYALRDPRDGVVRYVGTTVQALKQRLSGHLSDTGSGPKRLWIQELEAYRLIPEIVLLEEVPADRRRHAELGWIHAFLEKGAPLLNREAAQHGRGGTFKVHLEAADVGLVEAWQLHLANAPGAEPTFADSIRSLLRLAADHPEAKGALR